MGDFTLPQDRPAIDAAEVRGRVERAVAAARARGLAGLLVWGRGGTLDAFSDLHYFSRQISPGVWVPPSSPGLAGCEQGGLLIEANGSTTLLVSDFVSPQAVADRVVRGWDLAQTLIEAIEESGLPASMLGVVGEEILPYSIGRRLEAALPDLVLVGADDISHRLRRCLSEREQEMMLEAGRVGSRIYAALGEAIAPGATEGDAVGRAWAEASRTPGCAHWNFLAASGPDAGSLVRHGLPPWDPGLTYRAGDVAHIDCYGFYDGYAYDLARTVVVGGRDPSELQGARRACDAIARSLRPGVTVAELHAVGATALAADGLEPGMGSFGHGIGAGFFPPYVVPGLRESELPLEPPTAMAIEVFARTADGRAAYHEDDYLLTEDGVIRLTRLDGDEE